MPFIPLEVFTNNPSTTVSSGGTTGPPSAGVSETWTVGSSASFPAVKQGATQFHVSDPAQPSEVIAVTAISGTTWTVTRGADTTIPVVHASGFTVVQVVNAGTLANMQYPPWQFPVQQYGAEGDGKIGTGGTGASGQAVFTDAGATFVNATAPAGDVGKYIIINQGTGSASAPTNPFVGTILSVNSSTSVNLSANLAATCTAAPYVYGTDDTAAINSAVLAAAQWAVSTGNYKAQVMFEPQLYMLGTLVQSTTYQWSPFNLVNYTYNTHIPVPFTTQYARKLVLDFIGVGDASEPDWWGSTLPSVQGTCLVSGVFPPSQPDATFGSMSVIGTPSLNTNIGSGGIVPFANVLVNSTGICVVTPYNGQQHSFDFRFAAQANVDNGAALAFAPVNFNAQTVGGTWLSPNSRPSNTVAIGLAMPLFTNNDNCNIGKFAVEGIANGFQCADHFNAFRIATIYCNSGLLTPAVGSVQHGGQISYWSCEGCNWGITTAGLQGSYSLNILKVDFETINSGYINDSVNTLQGVMYWNAVDVASPTAGPGVTGAQSYKIINTRQVPGKWAVNSNNLIPAPPAAPATTVAQQNTAWRDATIYLSGHTGITGVSLGPASGSLTALGLVAASGVVIPIRVPTGQWYSVTYTGTLTTVWWLE